MELKNDNLEIGVLPESSVVKAYKLFTIHQNKIIKKLSLVKSGYFGQVAEKIINLLEN